MTSLSTASLFTQKGPKGLWRGDRRVCSSATRAAAASSSSSSSTSSSRRGLCVSAFVQSPNSSQRRRLLPHKPAARRTSRSQKSVVDEPLPYEGEEDGDDDGGFVMPELPGQQRDFWEGPQFGLLGIFLEYLWAFGLVVALGGCLVAVQLYNEGATDFKETELYKESMRSQGILEAPSDSKVFDEPPSQEAPPIVQDSSS